MKLMSVLLNQIVHIYIGFYFLFFIACNKIEVHPDPVVNDPGEIQVLFIGNSLTYTNDLPALLASHAKANDVKLNARSIALPNYALLDHLAENNIVNALKNTKFNYIIVQQGPSSQAEGRAWLIEGAIQLKALADKNGAKLCIFMVWPAFANYGTFDGVIKNHSDAAQMTNSILCPVGLAWKEFIDKTNDLSYYGPDLFHPSLKGSKVAAEIIFKSIFK